MIQPFYNYFCLENLYQLKDYHHRSITLTRSNLYDTGETTVTVYILRCDLIKHLAAQIYLLGIALLACILCRYFLYIIKYLKHLTTCVQSGRKIFLDLFLNFVKNGYFLAVFILFYTLAILILLRNLYLYGSGLEVVLLLDCQRDQLFCDLLYFLGTSLGRSDAAVQDQHRYLVSQQRLTLAGSLT